MSKTDKDPYELLNAGFSDMYKQFRYRFPNNTLLFERWVEEQAELHRPFYCGGLPLLDNAPCCVQDNR